MKNLKFLFSALCFYFLAMGCGRNIEFVTTRGDLVQAANVAEENNSPREESNKKNYPMTFISMQEDAATNRLRLSYNCTPTKTFTCPASGAKPYNLFLVPKLTMSDIGGDSLLLNQNPQWTNNRLNINIVEAISLPKGAVVQLTIFLALDEVLKQGTTGVLVLQHENQIGCALPWEGQMPEVGATGSFVATAPRRQFQSTAAVISIYAMVPFLYEGSYRRILNVTEQLSGLSIVNSLNIDRAQVREAGYLFEHLPGSSVVQLSLLPQSAFLNLAAGPQLFGLNLLHNGNELTDSLAIEIVDFSLFSQMALAVENANFVSWITPLAQGDSDTIAAGFGPVLLQ